MKDNKIKVFGRSDDLIYTDGNERYEIYANYGKPTYLLYGDGTLVEVEYSKAGIWKISLIINGAKLEDYKKHSADNNYVEHDYSEVLQLTFSDNDLKIFKIDGMEWINGG